jgi:DNA-binding YbaB/EbfC family protein
MNPPDLQKMLEQAQEMQGKMGRLQAELASKRFEASAGGGMITAVATGDLKISEVRIEDDVFQQGDRALIQDLVAAAVNAALATAQHHVQEKLQGLSLGGFAMPKPGGGDA